MGFSAPGAPVGRITASAAAETGLPDDCVICGGTTGASLRRHAPLRYAHLNESSCINERSVRTHLLSGVSSTAFTS